MTTFELFEASKVIAVVGLSPDPSRASYSVAARMQRAGYTIVPVNPTIGEWKGLRSYPKVSAIPDDIHVDIVDVFRRDEFLFETVEDALTLKRLPRCIWLQQGLASPECKALCDAAGIMYIEDNCLAVEYGYFHSLHAAH